jgi:hypothetical protein
MVTCSGVVGFLYAIVIVDIFLITMSIDQSMRRM